MYRLSTLATFLALGVGLASVQMATATLARYQSDGSYDSPNNRIPYKCQGKLANDYNYYVLGDIPNFPYVGGFETITSTYSPSCGACYAITYNDKTIFTLAVDGTQQGITLSRNALYALTGGLSPVDVSYSLVRVPPEACIY